MKNKVNELREKYQKLLVSSEAEWKYAMIERSKSLNVSIAPRLAEIMDKHKTQIALYEQFISDLKGLEEILD